MLVANENLKDLEEFLAKAMPATLANLLRMLDPGEEPNVQLSVMITAKGALKERTLNETWSFTQGKLAAGYQLTEHSKSTVETDRLPAAPIRPVVAENLLSQIAREDDLETSENDAVPCDGDEFSEEPAEVARARRAVWLRRNRRLRNLPQPHPPAMGRPIRARRPSPKRSRNRPAKMCRVSPSSTGSPCPSPRCCC